MRHPTFYIPHGGGPCFAMAGAGGADPAEHVLRDHVLGRISGYRFG